MFFDGYPTKGKCNRGTVHQAQGLNFSLPYDEPENGTQQASWRFCQKCFVMFFDGYPDKGHCFAGGAHEAQGYNFSLPHDVPATPNQQTLWRYCQYCHSMFFDGYPDKGLCPGALALPTATHGGMPQVGGHSAEGLMFSLPHDLTTPAPAPAPQGEPLFFITGPVWTLSLDHQQSQTVETLLDDIKGIVEKVVPGLGSLIATIMGAEAQYISFMDTLGGNQGVDINGVVGTEGIIVTPHASGMAETLLQAARVAVAVATIVDFLLKASGQIGTLGSQLGVTVAATVAASVGTGTPLGWALAGAFGTVIKLLEPAPNQNDFGAIKADRTTVGPWETFILAAFPTGNYVAILSWEGLFSAQNGGGADVYANRPTVSTWETWTLIHNPNGTVSLQSTNGHYLTATNEGGNGSYCMSDRTAISNWEQFYIVNQPGGHIAIKTHDQGTYLSVQPRQ